MTMTLPEFTVLDDQYALQHVLNETDPFGISYLGWNMEGEEQVIIREFFPERLAQRDADNATVVPVTEEAGVLFRSGLKFFLKTASVLEEIDHPNIARERASIETHGTAYRVRDHHAGTSLPAALEKRGTVSEQAALAIMQPVLGALHAVHERGLLHGRLTPDAVFLTKDRRMLLTGFRCAEVQLARKSGRPAEIAAAGFSPPEQYTTEGKQGPWTDVYAVAATLYHMIAGETLPEATERLSGDPVPALVEEAEALSKGMKHVLLHGLAPDPSARQSSAEDFRQMLEDPAAVAVPAWVATADEAGESATAASAAPLGGDVPDASDELPAQEAPAEPLMTASEEEHDDSPEADETPAQEEKTEDAPVIAAADPPLSEPLLPEQSAAEAPPPPPEDTDTAEEAPEGLPEEAAADENLSAQEPLPAREAELDGEADDKEEDFSSGEEDHSSPPAMDRGPRKPRRKKRAMGQKAILAIGGMVLLASLGGAVMLLAGSGGGAADRYAQLRAAGDSLFQAADYAAARQRYAKALKLQPDGASETGYLKRRLERIGRTQASLRKARYERQMARGDSLRARAEVLSQRGATPRARDLYAQANEAYLAALESRPSDSLAYVRAQAVNRRITRGRDSGDGQASETAAPDAEEMREQLYQRYRQRGDELLAEGNYIDARRKYREALGYRPGDAYAQARLNSIRALMSEAERERQFARYRERGDSLFAQSRYRAARREYMLALDVNPDSPEVQARIEQIDSLQAEAERRRAQYQYLRAQGDVFFEQEQYEQAITKYEEALSYKPENAYVKERIAEAERRLAAAAQEVRRKRMMEDGVYVVVDEQPQLIGGLAALHEKVEYPRAAIERGTEGRVIMSVVVGRDGRVRDAKIVQGIGKAADAEALHVVRQARFEPALVDGEPVRARHSLWIQFNLERRE